ncbi:NAD-dependent succinate-semialdehyde dehydrogenase [Cellulomonas bogoriensis]|uniref:Succinate-semialdehyde dehydrogenase n=1 Tax=Cellulomonas bogoriensis 69B4 = DSM 16987 TaxID=1386082 RepID=A0A0A0C0A7_9CELL|nr:NAD-dependent succinate-semialdehyde dehydrogenase [Cellulomonas bogoriensis]KGM13616.1 succinate-semialdehyde dehydrogenase [Cellulomonas bogoriensis 69B4 = DSM 16987]
MSVLGVTDPTTGEVVHTEPAMTDLEVQGAVDRARAAFPGWADRSFAERAEVLRAVAARLRADRERLGALMTVEMGKPVREARGEVEKAAWAAEHYADHAETYLATEDVASDATRSYVQHLPLGPALGILPWNAPFWLAFRFLAPALMAGNTALLKHDPHVPQCARAIAALFDEQVGAPPGLVEALLVTTPQVEEVIRDPRVATVSFTGSTRGGAAVASIAAGEIKPHVLELGGSDPAVVLEDADLDEAAAGIATMRVINAGQSCIAAKRVVVVDAVHDRFVELLHQRLAALVVGDPRDEGTDVGPLARADLRAEVDRQVQESVAAGAVCRLGGAVPDGPGYFYPVTLLTDVTPDMTVSREETFGPVAAVLRVASVEDAMRVADDTPYGLGASIWTSAPRGEALARRFMTGQVAVNGIVKTDPRLPSGGVRRSGYGRELGRQGILHFVNAQQVWVGPRQA